MMELVQKKGSNKHTFTFHDDYFNYAVEDKNGSLDENFRYIDFPNKSSVVIERNEWLRNVGALWIVIGLFQLGSAMYAGDPLSGKGFWMVIGILCIGWSYFSTIKYSVFAMDPIKVYVIQERYHDVIVEEIKGRRIQQLRKYYGDVDPENDPENEIEKFRWLQKEGVISEEELKQKIAEIEFLKHDVQAQYVN